jgi:hypothetical protein
MQRPASRSRSAAERPLPGAVLLPSANTSAPPPTASSTTMTDLGFRTSQPRRSQRRHDDSWRKFGAPDRRRPRHLQTSMFPEEFGSPAAFVIPLQCTTNQSHRVECDVGLQGPELEVCMSARHHALRVEGLTLRCRLTHNGVPPSRAAELKRWAS